MMAPTKKGGGGESGGGFSRYCFARVISVENGKVLNYEIACNSCKLCVEKKQALTDKRIEIGVYKIWKEMYESGCQAKENGMYSSVSLESKLAPVIFRKSFDQKLISSTVIADGGGGRGGGYNGINIYKVRNIYELYVLSIIPSYYRMN